MVDNIFFSLALVSQAAVLFTLATKCFY